ncbi:carboxypeptidase-like regulatory domain-containing protein, partial [uncultured Bacteroides sp.]|uniref:carboxypeptidase-like regulatory domain-containing protein n=1 Tax=uncultured Bacteroides sp. TaxID=162156 RepID=UPI002609A72B
MESAKNYSSSMVRFLAGASLAFFASGIVVAANESSSPHADAIESILQQKTINGKVLDATGEPIIGANVLVKGTTNGTITDIDGNFTLNVPTECVLQISYIGFNTQEIKVTS